MSPDLAAPGLLIGDALNHPVDKPLFSCDKLMTAVRGPATGKLSCLPPPRAPLGLSRKGRASHHAPYRHYWFGPCGLLHCGGRADRRLSSDAFIPFRDNVDLAARAGVKYIVQTGGSVEDPSVTEAADEYGIAMVLSGIRLFHH